jgi:uncharacterized repeat protein (TIGR02543 family)
MLVAALLSMAAAVASAVPSESAAYYSWGVYQVPGSNTVTIEATTGEPRIRIRNIYGIFYNTAGFLSSASISPFVNEFFDGVGLIPIVFLANNGQSYSFVVGETYEIHVESEDQMIYDNSFYCNDGYFRSWDFSVSLIAGGEGENNTVHFYNSGDLMLDGIYVTGSFLVEGEIVPDYDYICPLNLPSGGSFDIPGVFNNQGDYSFIDGYSYYVTAFFVPIPGQPYSFNIEKSFVYNAEFLTLPDPPEAPEHYVFEGWYLDADFTEPYEGQQITSNLELYARFVLLDYTVTFVTGVILHPLEPIVIQALSALGALDSVPKVGSTFDGWYYDAAHTQAYDPEAPVLGDMTLYAAFADIILTVTLYAGGEIYATLQVVYGTTLAKAAQTASAQFGVNISLYSDADLLFPVDGETSVTSDISVYAELSEIPPEPQPGFFVRVGDWFAASWPWLVACAGSLLAGALVSVIISKKRG